MLINAAVAAAAKPAPTAVAVAQISHDFLSELLIPHSLMCHPARILTRWQSGERNSTAKPLA